MAATTIRPQLANTSQTSLEAPSLPPCSEFPPDHHNVQHTTVSSPPSCSSPPASGPPAFQPTIHLQVQTPGKRLLSFPTPSTPEPIPIYAVSPEGHLDPAPLYISHRPARSSGNCYLVPGVIAGPRARGTEAPKLSETTYRFGPGRPPLVQLLDPRDGQGEAESLELTAKSILSRAVDFTTSQGRFRWRYAGSRERRAAGADDLLLLEMTGTAPEPLGSRPRPGPGPGPGSGPDAGPIAATATRVVAQLIRNDTFRSPGSSRSSAGNGGRLRLDVGMFNEKARERAQVLVVTTALAMLKKEVDRRRAQQVAVMAGGAG
ncbi:hypothetical protein F5Y15DRAFT_415541 [Xylariaceae sp. FL0016]|nr:hypothetical protein F5Y15DRAFT_415541 [Xylariaceae sp. FL0016]